MNSEVDQFPLGLHISKTVIYYYNVRSIYQMGSLLIGNTVQRLKRRDNI